MGGNKTCHKFNYELGANRICKICGKDFHTKIATFRCKVCTNKVAAEKIKDKFKLTFQKKNPYPFNGDNGEALKRFRKIQRNHNKAYMESIVMGNRDALIAHYDRQFKEIQENGILDWVLDRRDSESIKAKNPYGKRKERINREYPNTRDMPFDIQINDKNE